MGGVIKKLPELEWMSDLDYLTDNDTHATVEEMQLNDDDFRMWAATNTKPEDLINPETRQRYEAWLAANKK